MRRLVLATRSAHKLREIREMLRQSVAVELLDLDAAGISWSEDENGIEIYDSFQENALAKARYFAERCDLPVLADDSGLCVDALGGAPGVHSKRFSGQTSGDVDGANNRRLLERMVAVPDGDRGAHYICVIALVAPDGSERVFEGRCDGVILRAPRGEHGFGYDPLFLITAEARTFAEMNSAEKNRISHRARAVASLAQVLG